MKKSVSKSLVFALVIALLSTTASINVAYADDGVTPQPTETPIVIGKGGSVVYSEPVKTKGGLNSLAISATSYRRAWSDAYWVFYPSNKTWTHNGSHNSESDLVEEKIWTDGTLKVKEIVVASCSKHTSGQYAGCNTSKLYSWKYAITAKTYSFFHKTGYVDQSFTTSETVTPQL
ncbi:MAG: hypothetical protein LLF94_00640 [Chlamydiales bacterium]|nr:hypothetical protein [Chlamydiales bacterium]